MNIRIGCLLLAGALTACGGGDDAAMQKAVATGVKSALLTDLAGFEQAAQDLQAQCPTPQGRGWDDAQDQAALAAMRAAWLRGRAAYERIEGAIAAVFPELDQAVDARYDGFLAQLSTKGGDDYAFDAQGVIGMHAVERILYARQIPAAVEAFERTLPGYRPAAYPATEQEAADLKDKLLGRLVRDCAAMRRDWEGADLDVGGAFQGLMGLMGEQQEKVELAASGEEESRYAQATLQDLRHNLTGTRKAYEVFRPWIQSKAGGAERDARIQAGFAKLEAAYGRISGDAFPPRPEGWSSRSPKPEHLSTPFGQLFVAVQEAVDPLKEGSLVWEMNQVAKLLGFPLFEEG